MPNCFQLIRKSAPEAGPVKFGQIDKEMCEYFRVPCHETKWHAYWYNIIGLNLAVGLSFEKQLKETQEDLKNTDPEDKEMIEVRKHHIQIIQWLNENFVSNAWYQVDH